MARLPKIRASYNNDAQFMLRLIHAVERDNTRPKTWKKKLISQLQGVANTLLTAPIPSTGVD